ncbi:hypothetical protein [Achromobacter phage Motura]|uniref:Uncharacterized protein n=1 Tax=Achromobacter phage Motura TaxID=2591403 RepID=A0A514CSW0_9CAUD|nr:hypothetical protein H1O15_gp227 [Achromobacter phage Motura]QDH83561.1 hypothetical protein [Achromobacter phage Motura]
MSYRLNQYAKRLPVQKQVIDRWLSEHADVAQWLASTNSEFAVSLRAQLNSRGYLSDNQIIAVRNAVNRSVERVAAAPQVDMGLVEQAFATAKNNGIKQPKMNLGEVKLSAAPASGRNPNAVYVKSVDNVYLGKIVGGKLFATPECTAEQQQYLQEVVRDPVAAAKAFGQRTGICCICSRTLTNGESIELGIGPICAGNMGWAM